MNGSGKISWTEFLAATIETKGRISEDEFSSAFDHLDFDKNGFISTSVRCRGCGPFCIFHVVQSS